MPNEGVARTQSCSGNGPLGNSPVILYGQDSPARFDDQGEVIYSVFQACDTENTGLVKVSKLVEYIRSTLSASTSEICGYLDDLSLLLDPAGLDQPVDWFTYKKGIQRWIDDIKARSGGSESYTNSPVFSRDSLQVANEVPEDFSDIIETSSRGSSGLKISWKDTEIISRVEELQANNRKLNEEKSFLRQQVESLEESQIALQGAAFELDKLRPKYEKILNSSRAAEKEVEELRVAVSELNASSSHLSNKYIALEKHNTSLQVENTQLEERVSSFQLNAFELESRNQELSLSLATQKDLYEKLQQSVFEPSQLSEDSCGKADGVFALIEDLQSQISTLKEEKQHLEVKLAESRAELSRCHDMNANLCNDIEIYTSTPFQTRFPNNLQTEMQSARMQVFEEIPNGDQRHIYDDSFHSGDTPEDNSSVDNSITSDASSKSFVLSMEKYSQNAKQIAQRFRQKKKQALRQMDQLAASQNGHCKEPRDVNDNEMELFANKIASLTASKALAEKRSANLLVSLRKMKEENRALVSNHDKALQRLEEASCAHKQAEKRAQELSHQLDYERQTRNSSSTENGEMIQQIKRLSTENERLRNEVKHLEALTDEKDSTIWTDKAQIEDMKRLVDKLEDTRLDSMQKLFDQEERLSLLMKIQEVKDQEVLKDKSKLLHEVRSMLNGTAFIDGEDDGELIEDGDPYVTLKEELCKFIRLKEGSVDEADISPDQAAETNQKPGDRNDEITENITVQSWLPAESSIGVVPEGSEVPDAGKKMASDLFADSSGSKEDTAEHPCPSDSGYQQDSAPCIDDAQAKEMSSLDADKTIIVTTPDAFDASYSLLGMRYRRRGLSGGSSSTTLQAAEIIAASSPGDDSSTAVFGNGTAPDILSPITLNEQDCEKRFNSLVLSFRTDQYTLSARVERQTRTRQLAEEDLKAQLAKILSETQEIRTALTGFPGQKSLGELEKKLQAVGKMATRVSSQSELHGCFLQERKISSDMNFLVSFADQLRRDLKQVKIEAEESRQKEALQISPDPESVLKPNSKLQEIDEEDVGSDQAESKTNAKSKRYSFYSIASTLLQKNRLDKVQQSASTPNETAEVSVQADRHTAPRSPKKSRRQSRRASCVQSVSDSLRGFIVVITLACFILYVFLHVKIDFHTLMRNVDDHYEFYRRTYSNDRTIIA